MEEVIRSTANSRVKLVKKLLTDSKHRKSEGLWVAEGVRLVEEVLASGLPISFLVVSEDADSDRIERIKLEVSRKQVELIAVSRGVMKELSDTAAPQGVAAVFSPPEFTLEELAKSRRPVLILDAVRDPGNLGTIARSALAGGAGGIILGPSSVDPGNPKALRGSMGALLRLPVVSVDTNSGVREALSMPILGTGGEGGKLPEECPLHEPFALLIGQEAEGISEEWRALADSWLTIPMENGVESLNVATAASVILFEAARQRRSRS
ncbi:RNA methyltransferase [bacterium]|nr:MAG: RNA methyltransferase [bacterium]